MPVRAQYNEILREAFDSAIEVLGYSGKVALFDELERNRSFSRYDDSYLSLWKIGQGLQELLGQEIAEMIMEKVMINMDRLCTLQQVGK